MKKAVIIMIFVLITIASTCEFNSDITIKAEDKLYMCNDCKYQFRRESCDYNKTCPNCGSINTFIVEEDE